MFCLRSMLRSSIIMHFCKSKELKFPIKSSRSPNILNDNLRFDAIDYDLYLLPQYPKITLQQNPYSEKIKIEKNYPVMNFFFKSKQRKMNNGEYIQEQILNNRNNRAENQVSIMLKFNQLTQILDIGVEGKKQYIFCFVDPDFHNEHPDDLVQIKYLNQQNRVQFRLGHQIKKVYREQTDILSKISIGQKKVTQKFNELLRTSIDYSDFEIIKLLITESLFDLSGLRVDLQLKRIEQLQRITQSIKKSRKIDRETEKYFPDE